MQIIETAATHQKPLQTRENQMGKADNEELRDATIAELARRHAGAISTNILAGHEQTLKFVADDLGSQLAMPGISELLIRTALACGRHHVGQLLIDLIQKCIDADAETAAIKEVERMEAAGKEDPARCSPKTRAVAAFAAHAP